ncbi:MAG: SAM-dependent methyltransferase, partial [Puniceicoccales bacterium]
VNYVHADLAEYDLGRACWDGVVVIFCHLPPELRAKVYRGIVNALKPGGLLLLECYGPGQMALGTGGPREEPLLLSADIVRRELAGLDFELLEEKHRPVVEGKRHSGQASVVQVLARRAIPAGNDGA